MDPNPARGMPLPLQRYWLVGKGAAKIRWRLPHDFNRCVRNLRKYFPKNPEGLCNILHQKAVGAPPGKGHPGEAAASMVLPYNRPVMGIENPTSRAALTAAATLLEKQPKLGEHLWAGPLAPIERPTQEPQRTRIFEGSALKHRPLPLPLDWREHQAPGHNGAVTVGRVLGIVYGPNEAGMEFAWAWGDFLDEEIIPDSRKARYLMEQGVVGASVDPGGRVIATVNPETGFEHVVEFTIGGATLVPIEAFSGMQLYCLDADGNWPDDDMDMVMDLIDEDEDCGCDGAALVAAVNPDGWKGIPLAMRDSVFDNDDAVKRITAWANGDVNKMRQAFMYYDPRGNALDPTSYRLPVGDIVNGELTLIFHAIYAAAALLSGAHGGLPNIPEEDKSQIRNVISEIYAVMAEEFGDSSIRAPWDRSAQEGVQMSATFAAAGGFPITPPAAWFQNPKLGKKSGMTVTPEGRVYGHLAAWGECHRDANMRECVMAPKSHLEYAPYHLGEVLTAEGEVIKVGKIVADTRHADIRLGMVAAADHYEHTGREIAVVRAGEDEYGIWVAGAMVPEADEYAAAKLRRSPLSGDWRRHEGHLELTAALAVNAPAFPVYSMEPEGQWSLVAAGSVYPEEVIEVSESTFSTPPELTSIMDTMYAVAEEFVESQEERSQRLADILEDESIYSRRERASRLESMTFAAVDPWTKTPKAAPAPETPAPGATPVPGAAPGAAPAAGQAPMDMGFVDRAAVTQYSVVADPTTNTDDPVEEEEAAPAPAPAATPPAPVTAQAPATPPQA